MWVWGVGVDVGVGVGVGVGVDVDVDVDVDAWRRVASCGAARRVVCGSEALFTSIINLSQNRCG